MTNTSPAWAGLVALTRLGPSKAMPCLPSTVKTPGAAAAIVIGAGTDKPAPCEAMTCCVVLMVTPYGTMAFTCPSLVNRSGATTLPNCTLLPPRLAGSGRLLAAPGRLDCFQIATPGCLG